MKTILLVIDPQKDFANDPNRFDYGGKLFVKGGDIAMDATAALIKRWIKQLDGIDVTFDAHRPIHIAHPLMWIDASGNHPDPFTIISQDDVANGVWRASQPDLQQMQTDYVNTLAANGRYQLCIWPPHCIIGSTGYTLYDAVEQSLEEWETSRFRLPSFHVKGSNWKTEHYSAIQADVPDKGDNTTKLNTRLIDKLADPEVGEVLLAGLARGHCVANTVTDIADNFGEGNIKKLTLLSDCTSDVEGLEFLGDDFVSNMVGRGMTVVKSTEWTPRG